MFKKVFQIVTTFGVLLAGYAGYVQVFGIVARGFSHAAPGRLGSSSREHSATEREATRLAEQGFGKGHWSTATDLPVRYYNHEKGYWMYAQTYQRRKDGKQLKFRPFALISRSASSKALKTMVADEAIIDLDQPLGLMNNKSGSPMKITHARIEGNVQLRDDKGTADVADDLVIGPLPYGEYDEQKLQITSESDVLIRDRDMRITGYDLLIQLRPKEEGFAPPGAAGSFDAKTAFLKKNVHIVLNDVGESGIMPGKAAPEQKQGNKTPIDVRCVGPMQVDLPKPRRPVLVGPPAPPLPTLVFFSRDVVVLRGKPGGLPPDQLDCDELRLKLDKRDPGPKPNGQNAVDDEALFEDPDTPGSEGEAESTGAGTEMALREAHATGHAVWLQSRSQGMTARCNELIHKKLLPEQADETYLRGDQTMKLWAEKIDTVAEGPDKGKIREVTTLRTIDATIFDDGTGTGNENTVIVARGPGIMEARPARDKPVQRKALWQDHLIMQPKLGPDNKVLKEIVLIGRPELIDPAQATLDCLDRMYITLRPKPKPAPATTPATGEQATTTGGGSYQIETLRALADVHMTSPDKVMTAREWLDAVFSTPPPSAKADDAKAADTAAPGAAPPPAEPGADPAAKPDAAKPDDAKPAEPGMTIIADRVWANIQLKPANDAAGSAGTTTTTTTTASTSTAMAGTGRGEIQEARLRGAVVFHQDPAEGKAKGTDVSGEALDLFNRGGGKMKFQVNQHDPTQPPPPAEKAALTPLARVVTEEMNISGPTIGLDQLSDYAWVKGGGTLVMMTNSGLLTDKEPKPADNVAEKDKEKETTTAPKKTPLTITWRGPQSQMRFFGHANNKNGGPQVAKAEFYQNVHAVQGESYVKCRDRMDAYMDRTVVLARPKKPDAQDQDTPPEPKPQIAWIDCVGDVTVVSRKLDPDTKVLVQKQQIQGDYVSYDKLTGNFAVPGPGLVHLWNREGQKDKNSAAEPGSPATTATRAVTPTSNPPRSATTAGARRAGAPATARTGSQFPRTGTTTAKTKARSKTGTKKDGTGTDKDALPPLKLTVVAFDEKMYGRYMAGKPGDVADTRWATFLGDVQAMNAKVDDEYEEIGFDRPPADFMYLTSRKLDVKSVPALDENSTARNYLYAIVDSQAKTRSETISADIITYDSEKQLFYAYAEEGHMVRIAKQVSASQPTSGGQSKAVKYNRKTGESEFIEPLSPIQFIDAKTGIRPGPPPDDRARRINPYRYGPKLKIPGRTQTERKGMTGK